MNERLASGDDLPGEYTEAEAAGARAAAELRRLAHELVRGDHGVEALEGLAGRLQADADALAAAADRQHAMPDWVERERPQPADGEEFENHAYRPVSGLANPWSIPLRVFRNGDRAVTRVVLGRAMQGAPDRSHGGFVAAIYDDLLGFLLALEDTIAFTAYLTVNYHQGTPIEAPVQFAAWLDHREGKKLFLAGECRDDSGELLTSCEALFIDASHLFEPAS